jgi:transcriptional regulator with PAS, ATPase and Fis domain
MASEKSGGIGSRWRSLLQEAAEPVYVLDRNRRLVYLNAAAEAILGMPVTDVLGIVCRPSSSTEAPTDLGLLAASLAPPAQVARGQFLRTPRPLPGGHLIDFTFLPLSHGGRFWGTLVYLRPLKTVKPAEEPNLAAALLALRQRAGHRYDFNRLPAASMAGRRILNQVELASRNQFPVLLRGGRGTGKRWLARAIHQQSSNADGAFIALACARLPATTLRRVVKEAMAGSRRATILFEDVQVLPGDLQAQIVESTLEADSSLRRIMASTSADLDREGTEGRLIDQFLAALTAFVIDVPALSNRLEDLPGWLDIITGSMAESTGKKVNLSNAARQILLSYSWPGNLDEMETVLATALANAGGNIETHHLPAFVRTAVGLAEIPSPAPPKPIVLDEVLAQVERRLIVQALARARGNRSRAAELLSIWRARLLRRMEVLGIGDGHTHEGDEEPEPDSANDAETKKE